ncbi:MAG: hydroxymethylglutaryl-CoA reductase, degradative [Candidatus Odinarchaeum yellowstonii]|uniref:3-hydroxy-3-methylglutaryl coenzyme A reductase n=1 Tax=Odinarchaeota yellowstonii (strain LCB_4) TaxID=1841599 RepID=A0AAF0D2E7_ODILC|nr:MAG: hydroxymethylglutaryl-CoA reductase, degradative [Candidatus Odinarchaeum yellowstonii]
MEKSSNISGFYKLNIAQRRQIVKEFAGLTDKDLELLGDVNDPITSIADKMIENVIGTTRIPLGIAVNFLINGRDYLIPMAIEEPSVVAAASNAAKIARIRGGFTAASTDPIMIGQIQVLDVKDPYAKKIEILKHKTELLQIANEQDPVLNRFGGGAKDIVVRVIDSMRGPMLVIHLLVDTRDAMGANAVNTMCEALTDKVAQITEGRVGLRIISNLAVYRLCRAKATFDKEALGGEEVVDKILDAYAFAEADIFRCATHNKGIMNGITALMLATCNDTRAVEAGAHAYAALNGGYKPLTRWEKDKEGNLVGSIELPMAVGLVGGATKAHPIAQLAIKILNVKTANELGEVAASLGLAQNFAAIRALATEGIQKGHMRLHARNIAITAGASEDIVDKVVEELVKIGKIRVDVAERIIKELQQSK